MYLDGQDVPPFRQPLPGNAHRKCTDTLFIARQKFLVRLGPRFDFGQRADAIIEGISVQGIVFGRGQRMDGTLREIAAPDFLAVDADHNSAQARDRYLQVRGTPGIFDTEGGPQAKQARPRPALDRDAVVSEIVHQIVAGVAHPMGRVECRLGPVGTW